MSPDEKARKIVNLMMEKDAFSGWMGIKILHAGPGYCTLVAAITPEMTNGFEVCHGGVTFSIADSALAFASNSHGIKSVSIETSISHTKPVRVGDLIRAEAAEQHLSDKLATYHVTLTNQLGETVALFKGTVYRTGREWETN
jgi:acyl-CoA thioesterase